MIKIGVFCVLCLVGIFLAPACSKSSIPADDIRFAYISKQRDHSFHIGIINGIKKEMVKKHVYVDVLYANNQMDVETQRQYIYDIIKNKKYKGIMISPNDSSALVDDIAKLDRAGIPFLFIDTPLKFSKITQSFVNDCGYVGTDNYLVGRMAFQFILEKMKGENIVVIRGVHTHRSSIDREEGFMLAIKSHPEFKVIKFLEAGWTIEPSYKGFSDFMAVNTRPVDAVFAYNDHMAIGASRYYDEHPKLRRPTIVGVDATVLGQKALLEGKIDAIVVQATELMGIEGLNRMISCVKSEKPIKREDVLTPVTLLETTTTLERSGKKSE